MNNHNGFFAKIHNGLAQKHSWYAGWHRDPRHQLMHWLVFVVAAFFITSVIFDRIDLSYNLSEANQKENVAKVSKPEFISNQLLIKIKPSAINKVKEGVAFASGLSSLVEINKTKKVKMLKALSKSLGLYVVEFEGAGQNLTEDITTADFPAMTRVSVSNDQEDLLNSLKFAKARLLKDPNIELVEYNYVVSAQAIPNDARWSEQWDMAKIKAPEAWDTQTDSSDVVVVVIDTGMDFTHPDLQANLWTGSNGEHGYTCIGTCSFGGLDDQGHGTHVAGTIGAVANNGIGIAGENWKIKLLTLKFLDKYGSGYLSDAVLAFQKVIDLKKQGVNIRVINNSWGGGGYTQSLKDIMLAVEALGIVNVCAAGNSAVNADISPMYPAAYDNRGIISVLATDTNDWGASFTNFGLGATDIAAPGVYALSTVPSGTCLLCDPSGYRLLSGTSMASPHVAGVAAAMAHINPNLTAAQLRDVILDPGSYDAMADTKAAWTSSGGRLNFAKAVNNPILAAPRPLNNFPIISGLNNAFAQAGETSSLNANVSDLDGDALRLKFNRISDNAFLMLSPLYKNIFPDTSGNSVSFKAPVLAQAAIMGYVGAVSDNRGGGDSSMAYAVALPSANHGLPPTGSLIASSSVDLGQDFIINFPFADPEGDPTYKMLILAGRSFWQSSGVFPESTYFLPGQYNNSPQTFRVSTQAIDNKFNYSPRYTKIVRIGGATGTPPLLNAVFDKVSGPAPLTVNIDMSGSTDEDGFVAGYDAFCDHPYGGRAHSSSKTWCTYDQPGTYVLMPYIADNEGFIDAMMVFVTVTPSDGSTPDPDIESPTAPANLSAQAPDPSVVNLAWLPSTDNVGVAGYRVYRGGTQIGTSTETSYTDATVTWSTTYSYTVKAVDAAGNLSAASNTATITTPANSKVSITSKSISNVTASSAKINWTTNVPSTGVVKYGTSSSNLNLIVSDSAADTNHAVSLAGLNKSTRYYYQITVTSQDGQTTATSTIANFRTRSK